MEGNGLSSRVAIMDWLVTIVIGVVAFEALEHVVFPLIWAVKDRKRASVCGPQGMLGKPGVVERWENNSGRITVDGVLWNAKCASALSPGQKVKIHKVRGLILEVEPVDSP